MAGLRHGYVRPDANERAEIADLEKFIVRAYDCRGIDPARFPWKVRIRAGFDGPRRSIEVSLPRHPADGRFDTSGEPGRIVFWWGYADLRRKTAIDAEIEMLGRHVARERQLADGGYDPFRPPASTFLTDMITRRALEHHDVDRDALVLRGSGAFRSPTPNADRCDVHRLGARGVPSGAPQVLPADFDCSGEFDVDHLRMWSFRLSAQVHVRPDPTDGGGEAEIDLVDMVLPETFALAVVGMRLREVVEHPVLADERIVIVDCREEFGWTVLRVIDPIVALA